MRVQEKVHLSGGALLHSISIMTHYVYVKSICDVGNCMFVGGNA